MRKFGRKLVGAFFDVRILVALCGIILSVAAHELFHIVLHWGEINSVHLLPNNSAIVEVIFTPSRQYNVALEEGIAYLITTVTLLLTVMLVSDIGEIRSEKTYKEFPFSYLLHKNSSPLSEQETERLLRKVLGI